MILGCLDELETARPSARCPARSPAPAAAPGAPAGPPGEVALSEGRLVAARAGSSLDPDLEGDPLLDDVLRGLPISAPVAVAFE